MGNQGGRHVLVVLHANLDRGQDTEVLLRHVTQKRRIQLHGGVPEAAASKKVRWAAERGVCFFFFHGQTKRTLFVRLSMIPHPDGKAWLSARLKETVSTFVGT